MNQIRQMIVETLAGALPDFTAESLSGGVWGSAVGPARWTLEPAADGFWLVLNPGDDGAPPCLATAPDSWPWPLKPIRQRPGALTRWQAEWMLQGRPGEVQRLQRRVTMLNDWFVDPRRQVDAASSATDAANADWRHLVGDALDLPIPANGAGDVRVVTREEAPLELRRADGHVHIRGRLIRIGEPLTSESAVALTDLLSVANAGLRGCRAVLVGAETNEPQAWIETQISMEELTAASVRQAVVTVGRAHAVLFPCCQALGEPGIAVAMYHRCLLVAG